MAKLKFCIHPLFFVFGLYYALEGKIWLFICFTLTALMHELGHSVAAERLGYKLNRIVLMPYGAMVNGDIGGIKLKDEVMVALAGPLLNMFVAMFFVSFWWLIPEIYAATETVVAANVALALINLIPAYPLDGGRIVLSLLSMKIKRSTAEIIVRLIGILCSAFLTVLFIVSCFYTINLSLLFFAAFILIGALSKKKDIKYIKLYIGYSKQALKRGLPIKRIAISEHTSIGKTIAALDSGSLNEVVVFCDDGKEIIISYRELARIIERSSISDEIGKAI